MNNSNFITYKEPEYFYRVDIFLTTYEMDVKKTKIFRHAEEFRGDDLLQMRNEAFNYHDSAKYNIEKNGKFILPFASSFLDFKLGVNATYGVHTFLVVDEEEDYCVYGQSEERLELDFEEEVLRGKGFEL